MKTLLVDEKKAISMMTTTRLESFGHEVTQAADSKSAMFPFSRATLATSLIGPLFRQADSLPYQAMEAGRNRVASD